MNAIQKNHFQALPQAQGFINCCLGAVETLISPRVRTPSLDIVIDLETLDTARTAAVLEVGAVCLQTRQMFEGGVDCKFYSEYHEDLFLQPFTQSDGTHFFWAEQDAETREAVFDWRWDPVTLARNLTDWVLDQKSMILHIAGLEPTETPIPVRVWGNGVAFDNEILRHFYENLGLQDHLFWTFRDDRCYRTVRALAGDINDSLPENPQKHRGLSDALYEAALLSVSLSRLNVEL